jgi:hypothetical protein
MTLQRLVEFARDKTNFETVQDYIEFARRYLGFAFGEDNLQAVIVSQNENHYRFFQYKEDGHYNVTRPINSRLMLEPDRFEELHADFLSVLDRAQELDRADTQARTLICSAIYTIQQCIGAALDALPVGKSNTARKINGDLFERLIRILILRLGVNCTSGTIKVPVVVDGVEQFKMNYQHDLIIEKGEIKAIGGVKTSSKDRIDKVFIDKFLYSKLTGTAIPHIAIFLNDVQRKDTKQEGRYGISATFLPGHFKGYTIKLNPLDGVYYCDIRPSMQTDALLSQHIRTIDHFFCEDLWSFLERPGAKAEIEPGDEGDELD